MREFRALSVTAFSVRCWFVVPTVAAMLCSSTSFAWAQAGQTPDTPPPALPPADVQKVLGYIADLDLLKVLAPLKLTSEQSQKILVPLRAAAALGATRRKEDYDALRALATDAAKIRTEALTGTPVPATFEARVGKAVADSEEKAAQARKNATAQILPVLRDVLTSEQKDEMERQVGKLLGGKRLIPAKYRNNPNQAPKEEVQDLAMGVFVERVLLNDRMPSLLGQLRPAASAPAPAADGTNPPAAPASNP